MRKLMFALLPLFSVSPGAIAQEVPALLYCYRGEVGDANPDWKLLFSHEKLPRGTVLGHELVGEKYERKLFSLSGNHDGSLHLGEIGKELVITVRAWESGSFSATVENDGQAPVELKCLEKEVPSAQ